MNHYIILILSILAIIIIAKWLHNNSKQKNINEPYTSTDGNLLLSDMYGNLQLTPNLFNDFKSRFEQVSTHHKFTNSK